MVPGCGFYASNYPSRATIPLVQLLIENILEIVLIEIVDSFSYDYYSVFQTPYINLKGQCHEIFNLFLFMNLTHLGL